MEAKIKKKAMMYAMIAIVLAGFLATFAYNFGTFRFLGPMPEPFTKPSLLSTFTSYAELKDYVSANSQTIGYFVITGPGDVFRSGSSLSGFGGLNKMNAFTPEIDDGSAKSAEIQFSSTNVQVTGVDEMDTVKADGKGYLYTLSNNTIYILKAYPVSAAGIVSKIVLTDCYPLGFFVNGDRLAILATEYFATPMIKLQYMPSYWQTTETRTFARVYDIQDRANPQLVRDFVFTGSYFNSRMIGEYVYFLVSQSAYVFNDEVTLPRIYSNSAMKTIEPQEISYINGSANYYQFSTFVAMNVQNETEAPKYMTLMLGGTCSMYVSLSNMYITSRQSENTTIYRLRIQGANVTAEAKGEVPGYELNQFSMDENGDYFRIVTQTQILASQGQIPAWSQQTGLYVLDMSLIIVGNLTELGVGENLHSTRFMGNRCYLVTFMKTDPFFVIDLTEPTSPRVLGELKIPGYSDYLHPYDENHIIGVGKNAADSGSEFFAWYQGVKIALFDVTDPTNPQLMSNYVIGDRGTDTPVLYDHKAFLFDKVKNLLALPIALAEIEDSTYVSPSTYGTQIWQGEYVFNVTLADGIVFRGGITHGWNSSNADAYDYIVQRALYFEDTLCTVSNKKIMISDLNTLAELKAIDLS